MFFHEDIWEMTCLFDKLMPNNSLWIPQARDCWYKDPPSSNWLCGALSSSSWFIHSQTHSSPILNTVMVLSWCPVDTVQFSHFFNIKTSPMWSSTPTLFISSMSILSMCYLSSFWEGHQRLASCHTQGSITWITYSPWFSFICHSWLHVFFEKHSCFQKPSTYQRSSQVDAMWPVKKWKVSRLKHIDLKIKQ